MSNELTRAKELASLIERATTAEPAGTGTKIEIQEGDWELIVDALRALDSPEREGNQCDGCARKLTLGGNGIHYELDGTPVMGCTADRYAHHPAPRATEGNIAQVIGNVKDGPSVTTVTPRATEQAWIPVGERLPKADGRFEVVKTNHANEWVVSTREFRNGKFISEATISHWRESTLPPSPKEKE